MLFGEPGIGKTMLWQAGVVTARERDYRVLSCRGIEGEASLSFAGLSDLLGDVLDDALPSLVAPRRKALEVALLLAEPGAKARMRMPSGWRSSTSSATARTAGQWFSRSMTSSGWTCLGGGAADRRPALAGCAGGLPHHLSR